MIKSDSYLLMGAFTSFIQFTIYMLRLLAIKILLLVIYKFGVRKYGAKNQKIYYVYRFVCECYNGVTLDGKVIDHINDHPVFSITTD